VASPYRADIREIQAVGVSVETGAVLVPTHIGDDVAGPLTCAAAPLVAGSLLRRGSRVRMLPVPRTADPLADGDAALYLTTCSGQDGRPVAIAAAARHGDRLSAAHARASVEEWGAVADSRVILLAGSPWCSGAQAAVEISRKTVAEYAGTGRTVRILEPRSLPPDVAAELASLGAVTTSSLADAQPGDVVVFPSHGLGPDLRAEAAERGLIVVDATCPIIADALGAAARLADHGQHLVLIGDKTAAATIPITGSAAGQVTVAETASTVARMRVPDAQRVWYMAQPGMPVEAAGTVVSALRSRYPMARSTQPDGLCYAASDRAAAVRAVAAGSDRLFILGDAQAPDARQIAAQAREAGARVHHIETATDLTPAMVAGASTLGVAQSTSASAGLARAVVAALCGLGRTSVMRRNVSTEPEARSHCEGATSQLTAPELAGARGS
jgi:4-hydroxy-3-methylbut-2-en-1-yl diphosphate reductase